ncbi:MAG: class I [Candidatus Tokpelaia sp. JSC085]|nr:MAG: class I [Candidatus Tokpelaia sp. JSC085]
MVSGFSTDIDSGLFTRAGSARAWPFEEARKIIRRYEQSEYPEIVLFQTGYGPSGLPHIGTFGEVVRTSMVRHAFRVLTEDRFKTRLICFSDDMDGLRKIPENIPNWEMMKDHIGKPLTRVPDPFLKMHSSFGAANNARLCAFLDRFGFEYDFISATDYYTTGQFDEILLKMLAAYDKVMKIVLPTLGQERRATYSPFLPISPVSSKILQVPIIARDEKKGTIIYIEPETGEKIETEVTGGQVKCQWKADWAMRWTALGINYEMAGKDLTESFMLSSKICRLLDGIPPENFSYELFLDEDGRKISKSKGNGLTISEWLTYAPSASLSFYMYQKPKTAKRLYFDVIPRAVDGYYVSLASYGGEGWQERINNPVWHIHHGKPPSIKLPISFTMLLNLVSASNAENKKVLWGFISRYAQDVTPETYPDLDNLVTYAIRYFNNFVKPYKKFRIPDVVERETLAAVYKKLAELECNVDGNTIQNALLDIARRVARYQDHNRLSPKGGPGVSILFFQMMYEVLIGQSRGPRFGSFVALYGLDETKQLITDALNRTLVA